MEQRVCIVEDDTDFLDYVTDFITKMDIKVDRFTNAEDFLEFITPEYRGCMLTDIRLPGISGLALLTEVRKRSIFLPVVIISGFATVKKAVDAMKDGAFTVLEKPFEEQDLWEAVRTALAQEETAFKAEQIEVDYNKLFDSLSRGEKEVLSCIVKGMPNKNIAYDLNVSLRTIESRRRKVFQKMKADSVAKLVSATIAAKHRLAIDPEEFEIGS